MDKTRNDRAAKRAESIKEAIGKLTGDSGIEAEGAAEKAAGKKRAAADKTASAKPEDILKDTAKT